MTVFADHTETTLTSCSRANASALLKLNSTDTRGPYEISPPDHLSRIRGFFCCAWCTRNVLNMRALAEKAGDRYRFVGLSLSSDKLVDWVTENKLEFPVYTDLPILPVKEYKLGGTPETIVVSPEGRVIKVWFGAFADDTQKQVESYFGIALPGIVEPEKAATQRAKA